MMMSVEIDPLLKSSLTFHKNNLKNSVTDINHDKQTSNWDLMLITMFNILVRVFLSDNTSISMI